MPIRPWRDIALELTEEHDPERMLELAAELTKALDEQIGVLKERREKENPR